MDRRSDTDPRSIRIRRPYFELHVQEYYRSLWHKMMTIIALVVCTQDIYRKYSSPLTSRSLVILGDMSFLEQDRGCIQRI